MEKITSIKTLVNAVFQAIAVAMSVAVIITNILGVIDTKSEIILLGIGLFSLAIINFKKE